MNISLKNISKSFDDKVVLDNFSLELEDGKITVIMGESGIGKTTLLRILAGLDRKFTGEITPSEFKVSVAFQESLLFPGATVIENLTFIADREKSEKILLDMGIEKEEFELFPHEISGGMARRVSVARALLFNADLYLLDEPFSGLDEENENKLLEVISSYLNGKTVLIITHNVSIMKKLADKTVLLG